MSYIECPECGHRALSVATRCPHCSCDFPARPLRRPVPEPRPGWLRPALVGATVVLAGFMAAAALRRPEPTAVTSPPPAAPRSAPAGTRPPAPAQPAVSDALGSTPTADSAPTPSRSTRVGSGTTRYARTWVNVREERGMHAPPIRVLNPGEAVTVDSLSRGWYRVLADGRALGYVHRSSLGAVPPPARP